MRKKYQEWGDFLKKGRKQRYRSAREFCLQVPVGISYPQYSRYEAGEQLPSLEQAMQLCKLLEVPVLEGLLEWSRSQLRDVDARKDIDQLLNKVKKPIPGAPATPVQNEDEKVELSFDDVVIFNRSHLKLFETNPVYRDIMIYIQAFTPEWVSAIELSQALSLPEDQLMHMLEELNEFGIILLAGNKCRAAKKAYYFPDDRDFFQIRNFNVINNAKALVDKVKFEDLASKRAFRSVVTRQFSEEQLVHVTESLERLVNELIEMPDAKNPERIYSICALFGERYARPTAGVVPQPLKSEIQSFEQKEQHPALDPAQL